MSGDRVDVARELARLDEDAEAQLARLRERMGSLAGRADKGVRDYLGTQDGRGALTKSLGEYFTGEQGQRVLYDWLQGEDGVAYIASVLEKDPLLGRRFLEAYFRDAEDAKDVLQTAVGGWLATEGGVEALLTACKKDQDVVQRGISAYIEGDEAVLPSALEAALESHRGTSALQTALSTDAGRSAMERVLLGNEEMLGGALGRYFESGAGDAVLDSALGRYLEGPGKVALGARVDRAVKEIVGAREEEFDRIRDAGLDRVRKLNELIKAATEMLSGSGSAPDAEPD